MNNHRQADECQQQGAQSSGLRLLFFILRSMAFSVEGVIRYGFGSRFVGLHGLGALLVIPLFGVFFPGYDLRGLLLYLAIFVLCVLRERIAGLLRRNAGPCAHSRYCGRPWLLCLLPARSEMLIKRLIEPALVFLVGMAISTISPPLGSYLMVASFALGFSVHLDAGHDHNRLMDLVDSSIETELLAERFREMRGDRYS